MTLAEILDSLFPGGHAVQVKDGMVTGHGPLVSNGRAHVLGVVGGVALGVDNAIKLAACVLQIARTSGDAPILLLIDSGAQRMSKRDELLGLNEYLAHLAKALLFAERAGHRTIGLLYGHAAAGALIATGLATGVLVALPGATPMVMDLRSMARVTKLSPDLLQQKAETTSIFAPGLDNLAKTGAVLDIWNIGTSLAEQLAALLEKRSGADVRDRLGCERHGRPKAAAIAARVAQLAAGEL